MLILCLYYLIIKQYFKQSSDIMFAEFQNMIKSKMQSLNSSIKTNKPSSSQSSDISKVPQKYCIQGKHIQQLKLLSQGSFGFIWLAEDINTKQKFALKRIVCITKQRFHLAKQQLQLMMKLPKSKYLVGCFGGQLVTLKNNSNDLKVLIILMQYCPNGTLFNLLQKRQNKGFSQLQLVQIIASIFQGIRQIHQIQCYHQDIKLQNILIGQDKALKICDFGSCSNRLIDFGKINKSQYQTIKEEIEAVTTPMYRPPEIVDPYAGYQVGPKVDVWMAGCILYTLTYFTHPFVDSNAVGIVNAVLRFPKYPQQTKYQSTDKINDLIRHLLTPNPSFRPSVQQCISLLSNWTTLKQIPLNKEAKRMKQQYLQKQKQASSRIDPTSLGVNEQIPMQKLLQLQQKIRNKMKATQNNISFIPTNSSSLVSNKPKSNIESNNNNYYNNNSNNYNNVNFNVTQNNNDNVIMNKQKNIISQNKVVQKKSQISVDFDSFWKQETNTTKTNNNTNNNKQFDQFTNFFPSSHLPINPSTNQKPSIQSKPPTNKSSSTHPSDIFDYFFTNQPKAEQNNLDTKKTKQQNLIDL